MSERLFLPHPSSPARRGSSKIIPRPLLYPKRRGSTSPPAPSPQGRAPTAPRRSAHNALRATRYGGIHKPPPHFLRNIVAIIYAPVAPLRMDDCLSVVSADVLYAAARPRRTNNRNSRASESKASSSLECSAERSRESTKLTFYCVKQSQFYCVKQSQLCCVDNHEQPRRGESLFASREQPVYRLSPPLLRRGGFRRGGGTSPSRRGRVR